MFAIKETKHFNPIIKDLNIFERLFFGRITLIYVVLITLFLEMSTLSLRSQLYSFIDSLILLLVKIYYTQRYDRQNFK